LNSVVRLTRLSTHSVYYVLITSSPITAFHILNISSLVIASFSDFNGIENGSVCLLDYCGSPDPFQGRFTPSSHTFHV